MSMRKNAIVLDCVEEPGAPDEQDATEHDEPAEQQVAGTSWRRVTRPPSPTP